MVLCLASRFLGLMVRLKNNRILGSITHGQTSHAFLVSSSGPSVEGSYFENIVGLNDAVGFMQREDSQLTMDRATFAVGGDSLLFDPWTTPQAGLQLNATIRHVLTARASLGISVAATAEIGMINVDYSAFGAVDQLFQNATPGANIVELCDDLSCEVPFDVDAYGSGAYLIPPPSLSEAGEQGSQIGAEGRYRYHDGVLTACPLWPWPMEERILAETGRSVTWEANGGLWRSLEGVYP